MYRRIKARAASEGRSTKALILQAVEHALSSKTAKTAQRVRLPLVRSRRPGSLQLDNERIYDAVSFP